VSQLSLFSAEARPAGLADLAGVLCGPGQIVRFGSGDQARLSVLLADASRAAAVTAAFAAVGLAAQAVVTENGATAVRTAFRCDLVGLARAWTRGAVKHVPEGWDVDGAALRMWVLTSGWPDERGGYLLALDQHAPQTHLPLIGALTRAGLPPARMSRIGALRISGTRRVQRLVELVGPPPARLPAEVWPRYWGRASA
jgi:hypothetical protein